MVAGIAVDLIVILLARSKRHFRDELALALAEDQAIEADQKPSVGPGRAIADLECMFAGLEAHGPSSKPGQLTPGADLDEIGRLDFRPDRLPRARVDLPLERRASAFVAHSRPELVRPGFRNLERVAEGEASIGDLRFHLVLVERVREPLPAGEDPGAVIGPGLDLEIGLFRRLGFQPDTSRRLSGSGDRPRGQPRKAPQDQNATRGSTKTPAGEKHACSPSQGQKGGTTPSPVRARRPQ